jgi:hypothetical protein
VEKMKGKEVGGGGKGTERAKVERNNTEMDQM